MHRQRHASVRSKRREAWLTPTHACGAGSWARARDAARFCAAVRAHLADTVQGAALGDWVSQQRPRPWRNCRHLLSGTRRCRSGTAASVPSCAPLNTPPSRRFTSLHAASRERHGKRGHGTSRRPSCVALRQKSVRLCSCALPACSSRPRHPAHCGLPSRGRETSSLPSSCKKKDFALLEESGKGLGAL